MDVGVPRCLLAFACHNQVVKYCSCCHSSLLFTPSTAVALAITHSRHDSTPILASQISLPLVSLLTKPYSFDTLASVAEIGSCSHLRILYQLTILSFHNNRIVASCVLQSLSHPNLWTDTHGCMLHTFRGHYLHRLHYEHYEPPKPCSANPAHHTQCPSIPNTLYPFCFMLFSLKFFLISLLYFLQALIYI